MKMNSIDRHCILPLQVSAKKLTLALHKKKIPWWNPFFSMDGVQWLPWIGKRFRWVNCWKIWLDFSAPENPIFFGIVGKLIFLISLKNSVWQIGIAVDSTKLLKNYLSLRPFWIKTQFFSSFISTSLLSWDCYLIFIIFFNFRPKFSDRVDLATWISINIVVSISAPGNLSIWFLVGLSFRHSRWQTRHSWTGTNWRPLVILPISGLVYHLIYL